MYLELSKNIDAPLMSKSIHRCCCLRVKVHLCQRRQHQGGSSFLCRPTPPSRPGVLPGAPTCAVLARPCKLKKMQNCPRRRDISARRGPRTRRRGIVFPPRGCLFKQLCRYLMSNSAFTFTFSAKIVILMIWDKPHIHFL